MHFNDLTLQEHELLRVRLGVAGERGAGLEDRVWPEADNEIMVSSYTVSISVLQKIHILIEK